MRVAKWNGQRGQAVFEAVGSMLVVFTLVGGFLLLLYLVLARIFLSFAGEQALYCLAESRSQPECRRELGERLQDVLPIGQLQSAQLFSLPQRWTVRLQWGLEDHHFTLNRTLSVRQITGRRALPLSF